MRALCIIPALLLISAAPAQHYRIDATQSDVSAKVAFFGFASKTAHFPKVSGGITLLPADPERIDLTIALDATALTAPDSVTLKRLKGPKFFDVAHHPTIVFRGQSMRLTGGRYATVAGQITARGVTRPATLTLRFADPPLSASGNEPLAVEGETTIDRREFGMTAYPLIVGRKVRIAIRAVMTPA